MDAHEQFLRRFEAATLTTDEFTHTQHVRMAWLYLRAHPLPEALAKIRDGIRHFAQVHGADGLYHETITVAYALQICSRLDPDKPGDWDGFVRDNPELFEPGLALLLRDYTEQTLHSHAAKQRFIWPDR